MIFIDDQLVFTFMCKSQCEVMVTKLDDLFSFHVQGSDGNVILTDQIVDSVKVPYAQSTGT